MPVQAELRGASVRRGQQRLCPPLRRGARRTAVSIRLHPLWASLQVINEDSEALTAHRVSRGRGPTRPGPQVCSLRKGWQGCSPGPGSLCRGPSYVQSSLFKQRLTGNLASLTHSDSTLLRKKKEEQEPAEGRVSCQDWLRVRGLLSTMAHALLTPLLESPEAALPPAWLEKWGSAFST